MATPAPAETHAGTVAEGGEAYHEEALLLGLNAEMWVYISVTIFIILAVVLGKLPQRIAGALDDYIAGVRRQLDEAKAIRADAERLLADAKARQAAASADAAAIVEHARNEATLMVAEARANLEATIERRKRIAEDKVTAAGRAAEAEIRARAAQLAIDNARAELAERAPAEAPRLTQAAITELERRLA